MPNRGKIFPPKKCQLHNAWEILPTKFPDKNTGKRGGTAATKRVIAYLNLPARTRFAFPFSLPKWTLIFPINLDVTTCNSRYTRAHTRTRALPPSSTCAFHHLHPHRLPVCLPARRFHSLVAAHATYSSRLLYRWTEAGFHKSSVQRTRSLTRFYYFLRLPPSFSLSLSLVLLFFRSRSPLLIAQEQQVRLGGSVGGLSGVVLLRIYLGDGVKAACLLFFRAACKTCSACISVYMRGLFISGLFKWLLIWYTFAEQGNGIIMYNVFLFVIRWSIVDGLESLRNEVIRMEVYKLQFSFLCIFISNGVWFSSFLFFPRIS